MQDHRAWNFLQRMEDLANNLMVNSGDRRKNTTTTMIAIPTTHPADGTTRPTLTIPNLRLCRRKVRTRKRRIAGRGQRKLIPYQKSRGRNQKGEKADHLSLTALLPMISRNLKMPKVVYTATQPESMMILPRIKGKRLRMMFSAMNSKLVQTICVRLYRSCTPTMSIKFSR